MRSTLIGAALTLVLSGAVAAQEKAPITHGDEACGEYKMRVIEPNRELKFKTPALKPTAGVEYKAKVLNPCESNRAKLAAAPPAIQPFRWPNFKASPAPETGSAPPLVKPLEQLLPPPAKFMKK